MRLGHLQPQRKRTLRGHDAQQASMFSYLSPERRVPQDHPLRPIRAMVETVLAEVSPRFALLYSHTGRPSIPPEKPLRALLLQVLYTVRSERLLMEQLDYNLLFRWFVGLKMDDQVWDVTVFTKNRDRLDLSDFPTFLREKCATRGVTFSGPDSFFPEAMLAVVEKTWKQWLGPLVPTSPAYKTVIEALRRQVTTLLAARG